MTTTKDLEKRIEISTRGMSVPAYIGRGAWDTEIKLLKEWLEDKKAMEDKCKECSYDVVNKDIKIKDLEKEIAELKSKLIGIKK